MDKRYSIHVAYGGVGRGWFVVQHMTIAHAHGVAGPYRRTLAGPYTTREAAQIRVSELRLQPVDTTFVA